MASGTKQYGGSGRWVWYGLVASALLLLAATSCNSSGLDDEAIRVIAQSRTEPRLLNLSEPSTTTSTTSAPTTTVPTPPPTTTTTEHVHVSSPPPTRSAAESSPTPAGAGGGRNWDAVAQCESGGNWHINTGNGYYGGLQFNLQTWRGVGGPGYPHEHSREVQIHYAEILFSQRGAAPWPHCGKYL